MRLMLVTSAALCAVLLSACDAGPNVRQYSGPLDVPSATVVEVNTTAPVPGRYNVRATVIHVSACSCPPNALCGPCPPDGVLLSESGAPRPPGRTGDELTYLYVEAEDPEQFEAGRLYVLSVDVIAGQTAPTTRKAELLGYELAR